MKFVDKNKDRIITTEDIDALTDGELVAIRRLMPMGADSEEAEEQEMDQDMGPEDYDDGPADTEEGPGASGEEMKEPNDEVGDEVAQGEPDSVSEEADEKFSHTEL